MKPSFIRFAVCAFVVISSTRLQSATPSKSSPKITPAEQKAQAILRQVESTSRKTKTFTANFRGYEQGELAVLGYLRAMRPNLVYVSYNELDGLDDRRQTIVIDGLYRWRYPAVHDENTYTRTRLELPDSTFVGLSEMDVALSFFSDFQRALRTHGLNQGFGFNGTQKVGGILCRVLRHQDILPASNNKKFRAVTTLFINRDNIIQGITKSGYEIVGEKQEKNAFHSHFVMSNLKINAPLSRADFKFQIPPGVKQWKEGRKSS